MRRTRSVHRLTGVILLLPFFGWALTGLVFFIKPGYEGAYEVLSVKTYPLNTQLAVGPEPDWQELRFVRTILGEHLLVRTRSGWVNMDSTTHQPVDPPSEDQIRTLINDAVSTNPNRYGQISTLSGNKVTTTTGVEITLDWNRMSLQQMGKDTARIDWLYRIHYLQLTGFKSIDRVVGIVGIGLVLLLTVLGALLAFRRT